MIVRQENNLTVDAPKTYLSSSEAAGTTIYRVKNTTGLTNGWGVQLGETGQDRSEVVLGTNTNAGTITCAASDFEHPADLPVYFIKYNQVVFERSTAGTTGTATPMTNGTVEISADSPHTIFDDTTGSISYAYKTYLRNSTLSVNSTESDWIVITPEFYWLASIRQRVRDKLWNSAFIEDNQIDDWANEWKDEMQNAANSVNEEYSIGTVQVAFGTAGLGTVTTGDFKQARRVEITYNGNDWFLSTKQPLNEFLPTQTFNSTHPYHNWQGDTIFRVQPAESGGTAQFWFYRTGTPMVNDTDGLPLSMRAYTKSFVDYSLGQAYQKEGNKPNEAQIKFNEANIQKEMFVRQIAPRDKTGPTMVQFTDVVSG